MQNLKKKIFAIILCAALLPTASVFADNASDIQAKIDDNNAKIQAIQKEINQYSTLLNSTSKQSKTLSNALKTLELTQSKLEANLALTTRNISKANLTLQDLGNQIDDTEAKIASTSAVVANSLRQIESAESQTAVESFLNNRSISATWDYVNAVDSLQSKVKSQLDDLRGLEKDLKDKQLLASSQKADLVTYQKMISDQKQTVLATKQEKASLLADTSGREATYKQILASKVAQEAAYEKELFDYESQLNIAINPGSVPTPQHGILAWPIDVVRITQLFGKTISAKRLYTSGTHNGVDFGTPIGAPIKAVMSGTVFDTEPTKSRSGCQYGKFVLINHPDGLSTIYGHLSVVSVKPGDIVTTGDIIGYSGDTGYATGPHLHLGLYITAGIRIVDSAVLVKPPAVSACAGIKTVAAPTDAYLDPMAYLPSL